MILFGILSHFSFHRVFGCEGRKKRFFLYDLHGFCSFKWDNLTLWRVSFFSPLFLPPPSTHFLSLHSNASLHSTPPPSTFLMTLPITHKKKPSPSILSINSPSTLATCCIFTAIAELWRLCRDCCRAGAKHDKSS